MRANVHREALRAAAKVAFSVAFLGGCSAAPDAAESDDPVTGSGDGVEPGTAGTNESDLRARRPQKPKVVVPSSTACHGAGPAPKPSCEAVVNAAFPTDGVYPGVKQSVSHDVQTCCAELLGKPEPLLNHRWDCCANLPANPPQNLAMACTPWGPPVPPAMSRPGKLVPAPLALRAPHEVA